MRTVKWSRRSWVQDGAVGTIDRIYGLAAPSFSDLAEGEEIASVVDEVVAELRKEEAVARAEADQAQAELADLRLEGERREARHAAEAWLNGEPSGLDLSDDDERPEVIDLASPQVPDEVEQARAVAEIWRRDWNR